MKYVINNDQKPDSQKPEEVEPTIAMCLHVNYFEEHALTVENSVTGERAALVTLDSCGRICFNPKACKKVGLSVISPECRRRIIGG